MTQNMEVLTKLIELLSPMPSDERGRLMRSALVFLGDEIPAAPAAAAAETTGTMPGLPPKASAWMRQNGLTTDQLEQVFHIDGGTADIIATLPGRNKKEQTLSAYVMSGIGQLLLTGEPTFEDKSARALCERAGCYDGSNHSGYLKDRGNEFSGSKEKGWILTAPGLKRGAEFIKQMQSA
jgi:hypothetical protein